MFEDLIKEMEELERGGEVRMRILPDEKGYIDKECPRETCRFVFKVNADDWAERFKDEAVFCPRCRQEATSDRWWTTQQVEEFNRRAHQQMYYMFDQALRRGVQAFNQKQPRNSFISMSMSVEGPQVGRPLNFPMEARGVLEQELQCEKCQARYAVVGIAYFCPCCGHNSVLQTFDASVKKVETKVAGLGEIRKALLANRSADDAELMCQSVLESCFSDCVVAFQHVLERLFVQIPGTPTPSLNVFQRLQQGNELWEAALGKGYQHWLSQPEQSDLSRLFQQRHILAHRDGMVDQRYIDHSGDASYKVGQRLVVRVRDALELSRLVRTVVDGIRAEMIDRGLL